MPPFTDWQRGAIRELRAIARALPGDLSVLGQPRMHDDGRVHVRIRLTTAGLLRSSGGLPVLDHEDVVLVIGPSRLAPPLVEIEHNRFLGHSHVLQGHRLCIYLDPSREWDPSRGFSSALDRLCDWFGDAAAGRHDATAALYHAVGGVLHVTEGAPTVVVRYPIQQARSRLGYLTERTSQRGDLRYERTSSDGRPVPVFMLDADLPLGAGTELSELLSLLDDPRSETDPVVVRRIRPQSPAFLTAMAAAAARSPAGAVQPFILAVPHPRGGPPHLLAGRLPANVADHLRRRVRTRKSPLITVNADSIGIDSPVEWSPVSDERDAVTTRRDIDRPVNGFLDKTVHIWGCGGLGSWIAEFVARAGARKIVLCDPGRITGGLLVRQNYVETDIGANKAEALRNRLLAIRDDIEVETDTGAVPDDVASWFGMADLIIDATISRAIGQWLDEIAGLDPRPVFAQVALDVKTSTLGLVTVSVSGADGPNTIDNRVGTVVTADGAYEAFHTFWKDIPAGDEVVPTRGCSVPTFHGSAADIAAIAATLASFIGTHLRSTERVSGTHLIALPHSTAGPAHHFIAAAH